MAATQNGANARRNAGAVVSNSLPILLVLLRTSVPSVVEGKEDAMPSATPTDGVKQGCARLRGEFLGEGVRDFPFFFFSGDLDGRLSRSRGERRRFPSRPSRLPRELREDDRELLLLLRRS